jgi:hypothetical protein
VAYKRRLKRYNKEIAFILKYINLEYKGYKIHIIKKLFYKKYKVNNKINNLFNLKSLLLN